MYSHALLNICAFFEFSSTCVSLLGKEVAHSASTAMLLVLSGIEGKVEMFVMSNPKFKKTAADVFRAVDNNQKGLLPVGDAVRAVDLLFAELEVHLDKLGER